MSSNIDEVWLYVLFISHTNFRVNPHAQSNAPYASICSTMALPPLENSDHVVVLVYIDFPTNSKRDPRFMAWLMTILVQIGMVFMII